MRKLFVGGLNYETSEDDVGQYFKQFGPLQVCEYSNQGIRGLIINKNYVLNFTFFVFS